MSETLAGDSAAARSRAAASRASALRGPPRAGPAIRLFCPAGTGILPYRQALPGRHRGVVLLHHGGLGGLVTASRRAARPQRRAAPRRLARAGRAPMRPAARPACPAPRAALPAGRPSRPAAADSPTSQAVIIIIIIVIVVRQRLHSPRRPHDPPGHATGLRLDRGLQRAIFAAKCLLVQVGNRDAFPVTGDPSTTATCPAIATAAASNDDLNAAFKSYKSVLGVGFRGCGVHQNHSNHTAEALKQARGVGDHDHVQKWADSPANCS